jgi:mannose-1-phosphate guanylyltransferase/mannose-1-phosphate guanylyltransferase/mannose-6-phosphate isomerase
MLFIYARYMLDFDFIRINKLEFEKCRSESIDYAVMEKTREAVVIPLESGWSDIGSWSALWDIRQKDQEGNVIDGDVILHQSQE